MAPPRSIEKAGRTHNCGRNLVGAAFFYATDTRSRRRGGMPWRRTVSTYAGRGLRKEISSAAARDLILSSPNEVDLKWEKRKALLSARPLFSGKDLLLFYNNNELPSISGQAAINGNARRPRKGPFKLGIYRNRE